MRHKTGANEAMNYVRQVRGKWIVRMIVPEELRGIVGQRALVHVGLPPETRAREKAAIGIINSFLMQIEEAREVWEAMDEASKPTLASAAKEHYRAELLAEDLARSAGASSDQEEYRRFSRSVYPPWFWK